ncbi:MAG: sialidase family protein [Byssovorax sp.]
MKRTLGILVGLSALGAAACGPAGTGTTTTTTGSGGGGASSSSSSASSGTTGSGGSGGSSGTGGMGPVAVTVAPGPSKMLTCGTLDLTATVTGTSDHAVTWSVTPGAIGSIDAMGKYTAPIQVPTPDSVEITARSAADPTVTGSSTVTLSTTRPGAAVAVSNKMIQEPGVREHVVAAKGAHVYGVFTSNDPTGSFVYLAASTDSGVTWGAPVRVNDNIGDVEAENAVVAVDAADPKVVYVAYKLAAGGGFTKSKDVNGSSSGGTIVEATSTDGGATFTSYVLFSGGNGYGNSIDIVSSGPDQVVVSMPDFYTMRIYVDTAKGAGFAAGAGNGAWETLGVASDFTTAHDPATTDTFSYIQQNGGSDTSPGSGPRLASDGAGRVCVVYEGGYYSTTDFPNGSDLPYVQCSSDLGKTFAPALAMDTDRAATHALPTAAFGPNKVVTAVWEQIDAQAVEHTYLAQSTDGGKTFAPSFEHAPYILPTAIPSAPRLNSVHYEGNTLWLLYLAYAGGQNARLIADKSCDGGKTWSRAELTNGTEGNIDDTSYPGFTATDKGMIVFGGRDATTLLSVYPIE